MITSKHLAKTNLRPKATECFRFNRTAFLFLLGSMFIAVQAANAAERIYYSIHLASFKSLQNANKKVNAIQQKNKAVFWKKTDVPGKGEFYRVFIGKYDRRDDAIAHWHTLKKEGAVSYFGIYVFKENSLVPKADPPSGSASNGKPEKREKTQPVSPENRFIDNHDGTITDTLTNLMWIKNGWRMEFVSALTWQEAMQKCKAFNLGGYSNWRLSSINEWKSIIDSRNQIPAIVEPNPFENVVVHMPYWSNTEFALGGNYTSRKKGLNRAYTVMLYSGGIHHQRKSDRAFVLPVRSIE